MATLARIQADDLNGNECLAELYAEAVARGYWDNSEHSLHWFWSLAEKALRFERIKKTDSPGRLFHELIKRKEKRYSRVDEDLSQARLQSFEVHGLLDRCRKQSPVAQVGAQTKPPTVMARGNAGLIKHDRATCLAHGLFRSLSNSDRQDKNLVVDQQFGDIRIEWRGVYRLGANDLRVLQGLLALSGGGGLLLQPKPADKIGKQLRLNLFPEDKGFEDLEEDVLVAKCSYRGLASIIGYKNTATGYLKKSIERLFYLSCVVVTKTGKAKGFRLLSKYESDENSGKVHVAINPMISQAVVGGQHLQLDMTEIRKLKADCTRLIHQRLCAYIDPGCQRLISLDALVSYAWPEVGNSTTQRKRRERVKKALVELDQLGWTINETKPAVHQITRPDSRSRSCVKSVTLVR